jgi:hypothetical protein
MLSRRRRPFASVHCVICMAQIPLLTVRWGLERRATVVLFHRSVLSINGNALHCRSNRFYRTAILGWIRAFFGNEMLSERYPPQRDLSLITIGQVRFNKSNPELQSPVLPCNFQVNPRRADKDRTSMGGDFVCFAAGFACSVQPQYPPRSEVPPSAALVSSRVARSPILARLDSSLLIRLVSRWMSSARFLASAVWRAP